MSNADSFKEDNSLNKMLRSESYEAMPPPLSQLATLPRMCGDTIDGFDLLSELEAERPIVSPDLSARSTPIYNIPYISLDFIRDGGKYRSQSEHHQDKTDVEVDLAEDVVEDESFMLSPDLCADIVDFVFGDLDDVVLIGPPTKKRNRFQDLSIQTSYCLYPRKLMNELSRMEEETYLSSVTPNPKMCTTNKNNTTITCQYQHTMNTSIPKRPRPLFPPFFNTRGLFST
jgi:hypothetical protein